MRQFIQADTSRQGATRSFPKRDLNYRKGYRIFQRSDEPTSVNPLSLTIYDTVRLNHTLLSTSFTKWQIPHLASTAAFEF